MWVALNVPTPNDEFLHGLEGVVEGIAEILGSHEMRAQALKPDQRTIPPA